MPIKDTFGNVVSYPMSKKGVCLNKNILELLPEECLLAQNIIWKNGLVKRGGQSLLTTTEVVASKKILGLHRFYKADGSTQLLAACDTTVKYYVGPSTWTNAVTGLTTGLQTYMTTWGALNKVYICNGTDKMNSWTGSAAAQITIADGVPTQALPYQDRLLTIIGGNLTWSGSFDDVGANWGTAVNIGVKPDTILFGMTYHSVTSSSAGYETKVLLAGANGMYLFAGTDLRWPSTTGDYTIYPLAIPVGCNAPRTMVWTPFGTFWLGSDLQVYMLPFGAVTPMPVGDKIRSKLIGFGGLETVPNIQIKNACACYHDGFYKLSVAEDGQTTNGVQWWLDINRLTQDENGHAGPWYGPMLGQTISCFAMQNGGGDGGECMAGEATAKGYVYQVGRNDVYGDVNPVDGTAASIPVQWQSFFNDLGNAALRTDVHKLEAELRAVLGSIGVSFYDIDTVLKTGDSFVLSAYTYWNDLYWNDFYWNNTTPVRRVVDISPAIQPRRLSLVVTHNISNDTFELYSVKVETVEQAQVFA